MERSRRRQLAETRFTKSSQHHVFLHLESLQHLIDEKLHPVLRQPLQLHQLAEVGAHERHHQVTEEKERKREKERERESDVIKTNEEVLRQ